MPILGIKSREGNIHDGYSFDGDVRRSFNNVNVFGINYDLHMAWGLVQGLVQGDIKQECQHIKQRRCMSSVGVARRGADVRARGKNPQDFKINRRPT